MSLVLELLFNNLIILYSQIFCSLFLPLSFFLKRKEEWEKRRKKDEPFTTMKNNTSFFFPSRKEERRKEIERERKSGKKMDEGISPVDYNFIFKHIETLSCSTKSPDLINNRIHSLPFSFFHKRMEERKERDKKKSEEEGDIFNRWIWTNSIWIEFSFLSLNFVRSFFSISSQEEKEISKD